MKSHDAGARSGWYLRDGRWFGRESLTCLSFGAAAMSPHSHSADRNLLFGIIALQMDFITRDQLIAAMHAWVLDKHKPIGQVLSEQGGLSPEDHEAIEFL